jgi:nitroimidazol reductase NimA-like FMN-containing flavoprotein (pyridoxamine 5'-phosphate oxidase superfamily)
MLKSLPSSSLSEENNTMRKDIKELIQRDRICVLATVSGGEPHCSLMSYATDDDCREIYMATFKDTKKYRNLLSNPSVSLLVDSRETPNADPAMPLRALTISGTLQKEADEKKLADIRGRLLAKNADLRKIIDDPGTEIIVVRIRTVQLLDGLTDAYFEIIS